MIENARECDMTSANPKRTQSGPITAVHAVKMISRGGVIGLNV